MATCGQCKKNMKTANGCVSDEIRLDGKMYKPIPYGSEERRALRLQLKEGFDSFIKLYPYPKRCADCNVKTGQPHHPGCDNEECPRCHFQLIGCGCL